MPEDTVLMPKTKRRRPSPRQLRKAAIILAGAIAATLLVLLLVWIFKRDEVLALPCTDRSEGSLLVRAEQIIEPTEENNTEDLGALVEEIRQQKGYQDDVNCMYILLEHYTASLNLESAEESFEIYEDIFSEDNLPIIQLSFVKSPDTIRQNIEFISIFQQSIFENENPVIAEPDTEDDN